MQIRATMSNPASLKDLMRQAISGRLVTDASLQEAGAALELVLARSKGRIYSTLSGNTETYAAMLATLLQKGGDQTADPLWDLIPSLFLNIPRWGYVRQADGEFVYRKLADNNPVLFWTGEGMEVAEFDAKSARVSEFLALADKIADFLIGEPHRPAVVIDIGAGISAFAFYLTDCLLRADLKPCRIVNVERDALAVVVADLLVTRLNSGGHIANVVADLRPAINGDPELWETLRSEIEKAGPDAAVILVTRGALHPYFSDADYARLFPALIQHLNPRAGFHLELVGDRTPSFADVSAFFPNRLFIDEIYLRNTSDPLAFLKAQARALGIAIHEELQVWPQFIHDRLYSYLAWTRDDR